MSKRQGYNETRQIRERKQREKAARKLERRELKRDALAGAARAVERSNDPPQHVRGDK